MQSFFFIFYTRNKKTQFIITCMPNNPKYSLNIDAIESQAKSFVENLGSDFSFCYEDSPKQKKISIKKGKDTGFLLCFIVEGMVSFQIQGKPSMNSFCTKCKEHLVAETKLELEIANKKSYSLRDVQEDDLLTCLNVFKDELGYEVENKEIHDESVKYSYKIKGKYSDELTLHFYNNGTLLAQGKVTPLFLDFVVNCTSLLADNGTVDKLTELLSIDNSKSDILNTDLSSHITSNYEKIEGKLETFLKTSLLLVNNVIELPDYSSYCFSALRALEGIIKKRIIEESGSFDNFGIYFTKSRNNDYKFKEDINIFTNEHLCSSLEEAYTYLKNTRHPLFHVDDSVETSRTTTFDESITIINDCLRLINDICRNWD